MVTWKKLRNELTITEEDEQMIELEKELIMTLVRIREEKGLTQAQMAEICGMSQPTIARLERATHSPQLDSLFKILGPLGYSVQIVALKTNH